jgi:hypothetical protein
LKIFKNLSKLFLGIFSVVRKHGNLSGSDDSESSELRGASYSGPSGSSDEGSSHSSDSSSDSASDNERDGRNKVVEKAEERRKKKPMKKSTKKSDGQEQGGSRKLRMCIINLKLILFYI